MKRIQLIGLLLLLLVTSGDCFFFLFCKPKTKVAQQKSCTPVISQKKITVKSQYGYGSSVCKAGEHKITGKSIKINTAYSQGGNSVKDKDTLT